jgi:hypothetical protein
MDDLREELMYDCVLCSGEDPKAFLELFRKAIDLRPDLPFLLQNNTGIGFPIMIEWIKGTRPLPDVAFRRRALDFCVDVLRDKAS